MNVQIATRYWEDLQAGESYCSRELEVSRDEIVEFASKYDPQYFHMDPEKAKQSHFGEVVASGVHILALWRILDHEITGDVRWMCGMRPDLSGKRHPARTGLTLCFIQL